MTERGGRSLFPPVEVDSADPAALQHWQQQLVQLTGCVPEAHWQTPVFDNWTLARRVLLNAGSSGSKVYLLDLTPPTSAHWQAGIWSR